MKKFIWLALLGLLFVIQLIRPDRSTPTIDPAQDIAQVLQPSDSVQTMLKNACYDCHSYETKYPWYSQVAPVSWWLDNHIKEGREHLNFSTFGALSAADRTEVMEDAAEAVQEGEMPLSSYTWAHPAARLSAEQKTQLADWFNSFGEGAAEQEANGATQAGPGTEPAARDGDDDDD